MTRRASATAYLSDIVIVPGTAWCAPPWAAARGNVLAAATAVHGDAYAFCVRGAAPAPADAVVVTRAEIALMFSGRHPAEVLAERRL